MKMTPVVITKVYEYPDPWPPARGTCNAPHPKIGWGCQAEWPEHGERHTDWGDHPMYWDFSKEEKLAIQEAIVGGWIDPDREDDCDD
jgi:hypothetical protein